MLVSRPWHGKKAQKHERRPLPPLEQEKRRACFPFFVLSKLATLLLAFSFSLPYLHAQPRRRVLQRRVGSRDDDRRQRLLVVTISLEHDLERGPVVEDAGDGRLDPFLGVGGIGGLPCSSCVLRRCCCCCWPHPHERVFCMLGRSCCSGRRRAGHGGAQGGKRTRRKERESDAQKEPREKGTRNKPLQATTTTFSTLSLSLKAALPRRSSPPLSPKQLFLSESQYISFVIASSSSSSSSR